MLARKYATWSLAAFLMVVPASLFAASLIPQQKDESKQADAKESQPYLGLGVTQLHPALASQLGLVIGKGRGVLVEHVAAESPAAEAGLKPFDVLVKYGDHDLYSPEQLVKLVRNDNPGHKVPMTCVRNGKSMTTAATLESVPVQKLVFEPMPFQFEWDPFGVLEMPMIKRFEDPTDDPNARSDYESFSISKNKEGKYDVQITYRHENKKVERKFEGTQDEINKAVNDDKELPAQVKNHVLRSINPAAFAPMGTFARRLRNLERELFHWPHKKF